MKRYTSWLTPLAVGRSGFCPWTTAWFSLVLTSVWLCVCPLKKKPPVFVSRGGDFTSVHCCSCFMHSALCLLLFVLLYLFPPDLYLRLESLVSRLKELFVYKWQINDLILSPRQLSWSVHHTRPKGAPRGRSQPPHLSLTLTLSTVLSWDFQQ